MPLWLQTIFVRWPVLQGPLFLIRCPGGNGWAWRCCRRNECGCSNKSYYG